MSRFAVVCMVLVAGCRVQEMATIVPVDGGVGAAKGPSVATDAGSSGPVATTLAAQLTAAGLDLTNLPAIDDLTDEQIFPVMKAFSTALGTDCSTCHVEDKSAETPNKRIARKMWDELVRELSRKDGSPLFCDSCHQGKTTFLDRTDDKALASFMESTYVDGVVRKDGTKQSCTSCHGQPFDPSFLDSWAGTADGGVDGSVDAGAPTDAALAVDAAMPSTPCSVSVNEIQTAGTRGAADEFVELYNSCTTSMSLEGHKLVYRSGAGTSDTLLVALDGQSLAAGGYLVIGGASYSGTAALTFKAGLASNAGGVALLDGSTVIDRAAWGTATNAYVQGSAVAAPASGQSIARKPDGSHAHASDALDFEVGTPTPGATN